MTSDCPANIGPRGRRQRTLAGFVVLALAVAAGAYLVAAEHARAWRLVLFVPLWIAGLSLSQARAAT